MYIKFVSNRMRYANILHAEECRLPAQIKTITKRGIKHERNQHSYVAIISNQAHREKGGEGGG